MIGVSCRSEKADFRRHTSNSIAACVPDLLVRLDAGPHANPCELATLIVCQLPLLALAAKLRENVV